MVKTEYEKAFLEIKKIIKDEYFNFYLVYRNIKKSYFGGFPKENLLKVLQLCKKYNLHIKYKSVIDYNGKKGYACIVSKEKIPKKIKSDSNVGLAIGYPLICVKNFGSQKNIYGHHINVDYVLKNNDKIKHIHKNPNIYYFMCNKPLKEHMKLMKKNIVNDIKKNLIHLFSYVSIKYEITKKNKIISSSKTIIGVKPTKNIKYYHHF